MTGDAFRHFGVIREEQFRLVFPGCHCRQIRFFRHGVEHLVERWHNQGKHFARSGSISGIAVKRGRTPRCRRKRRSPPVTPPSRAGLKLISAPIRRINIGIQLLRILDAHVDGVPFQKFAGEALGYATGKYQPELLFADYPEVAKSIARHPALLLEGDECCCTFGKTTKIKIVRRATSELLSQSRRTLRGHPKPANEVTTDFGVGKRAFGVSLDFHRQHLRFKFWLVGVFPVSKPINRNQAGKIDSVCGRRVFGDARVPGRGFRRFRSLPTPQVSL